MTKLLIIGLSLLSFAQTAGAFEITFKDYSTFSNDYKIAKIIEIRAQIVSSSYGGAFRRDCYKEYHSNFPYAPQTVSYVSKQNLDSNNIHVKDDVTVIFKGVTTLAKLHDKKMKDELNWGCQTNNYLVAMVKGVTVEGHDFKSDLFMDFKGRKVSLRVGSYIVKLDAHKENTSDLIPTAFMGHNWDNIWQELDPGVSNTQTNF